MEEKQTRRSKELAEARQRFLETPEEQRIREFVERYPPDARHTVEEWMEIHRELTGACGIGGYRFIHSHGFKRYEQYTTLEFLDIVDGVYGGDIIRKVKRHYEGGTKDAP